MKPNITLFDCHMYVSLLLQLTYAGAAVDIVYAILIHYLHQSI